MSSILNIDKGGGGWNYSDSSKPNFMQSITGTVVEINEVQSTNWKTGQPEFFDLLPGQMYPNPKLNIQLVIQGQSGRELPWQFMPRKGSIAFDAVVAALKQYNPDSHSIADVGGLMVRVSTQYETKELGKNARPWQFEILGPGSVPFRGVNEFDASKLQQPQVQAAMPQQPMLQHPMVQQPMAQPMVQQQPMQAMPMQQPAMQQQVPASPLNRDINGGQQHMVQGQTMQQEQQFLAQPGMQQAPVQQQPQGGFADQYDPAAMYDDDIPF